MSFSETILNRGNKLIANFDGWVKQPDFVNGDDEVFPYYEKDGRYIHFHPQYYHKKWGWLMPIVEKIEALNNSPEQLTHYTKRYSVTIYGKICIIGAVADYSGSVRVCEGEGETKIEAVWLAVVNFIKWYNKQNKL